MSDSNASSWPPPGIVLAPSLLAADFARLGEEADSVEAAGADWLHLDVMDGHFVPNISFGIPVLQGLRKRSRLPFDVHLMVAPVDAYIAPFAAAGADHITVHVEAGPNLHRTLQSIRALGKRAGVALNPATPAGMIEPVLDDIDQVLVMTVNPGFGGQSFIASQWEKIRQLRDMVGRRPIVIGADGGVALDTAARTLAAGATMLVAGTAVFGQADRRQAMHMLRGAA